ncbi:hypothetical protein V8G54_010658 [Vigna mungo]|uniref:Uncharacterized protein n=1 Tax=Vigna mungo TaxID=3915 RepID=A0AAQ3NYX5_VIGMU
MPLPPLTPCSITRLRLLETGRSEVLERLKAHLYGGVDSMALAPNQIALVGKRHEQAHSFIGHEGEEEGLSEVLQILEGDLVMEINYISTPGYDGGNRSGRLREKGEDEDNDILRNDNAMPQEIKNRGDPPSSMLKRLTFGFLSGRRLKLKDFCLPAFQTSLRRCRLTMGDVYDVRDVA